MKLNATIMVEKQPGEKNFSTYIIEDMPGFGLHGWGATAKKAIEDTYIAMEDMKSYFSKTGREFPELEFSIKFDIGAFFNYYDYLNISAVAREIGINPSVLRQYALDIRTPKAERKKQIEEGLHKIGNELSKVKIG